MSFLLPTAQTFQGDALKAMASFCHYIFFFPDRESAVAWTAHHPDTLVISVSDAINEPRYASLKAIMGARKKPQNQLALADLGVEGGSATEVLDLTPPPAKEGGRRIEDDNGSSAEENQAIVSLKGDSRAPDAVDVGVSFAVAGAAQGLYSKYFVSTFSTIPRSMKDTRGFWWGDYWGAISIGYNQNLISNPPTSFKDLMKPEYKGKVAVNGSPLSSNSAVSVVIAASLANGGSLKDVGPGIDFFATLKKSGNYIPVGTTSATVASGQTPISLDWDYNNLAYVKEFPSARWKVNIPTDGVYGGHYAQAVSAYAPHPWAARLWEEFIYSDQGQLLYLKGFAHPSRFNDLANRKKIPASLLSALPAPSLYAKAKFASLSQQTAAKAKIATDWPAKVG